MMDFLTRLLAPRRDPPPMMKQITPEMNLDIYRTLMKMSVVIVRLAKKYRSTREIAYKELKKSVEASRRKVERAYALDTRWYKIGGKSEKIMAEYEEACREFHRDIFMVEIKVNPDNAEETLLKWLRVNDQL